jgi:uroporphyrinogen decarboxylase
MTDRQRFNNQMHYKPFDRTFNMEFGYWEENFQVWPMFVENGIRGNWEADRFFSFDRIEGAGGHDGMNPPFPDKAISETATHRIFMNGDGLLAEVPKDGHSTIPHYIKSSIETPDDWKKVKAERFRLDDPVRKLDVAAIQKAHPPTRDYPLGINCGSMIGRVRDMLTFEGLAYATYDYPAMVEDMVETRCQLVENILDQVLGKVDFDYASGWEDICFNKGPIVSVDFYRRVITPRYRRISDRLHKHGIDLWWTDCDGDVRPIMTCLLDGGINCLFPFEVNSCAHPAELFKEYGKDLRIMGGVDKIEMGKGRKEIRTYLEGLIPMVERGGYIPFCDHRCPPNVSQDNYLYYLDTKEELFGMK